MTPAGGPGRARRPGHDRAAVASRAPQRRRRSDRRRAGRRLPRVSTPTRTRRSPSCTARAACSAPGADLKAVGYGGGKPRRGRRRRADGADPDAAVQARDRRHRRPRRRGRPGARAVVRPAGRRGGRGVRRVLPPLGRPADRRRHRPPAASDRREPGDGPDPHRTAGGRRRGRADRPRQPRRPRRREPGRRAGARRASWPASRRPACAQDRLSAARAGRPDRGRRASPTSSPTAGGRWPRCSRASSASGQAPAVTAPSTDSLWQSMGPHQRAGPRAQPRRVRGGEPHCRIGCHQLRRAGALRAHWWQLSSNASSIQARGRSGPA